MCNMWVRQSDIDCNMWTAERIPNFFARLKRAVLVSDGSASVEVISGARVPVAKILAHGQRFDVTHEFGEANEIALHHRQVQTWARRWANSDPAIW